MPTVPDSPIPPIHDPAAAQAVATGLHVSHAIRPPRHDPPLFAEAPGKSTTRSELPPGHPGFLAILEEMETLHRKKGADYGTGDDFLANVKASEAFGVPAWVGTMVRAHDKMIRIQNAAKGNRLHNEGVEDSLMDLAAYAIIALVLYREQHGS